MQQGSSEQCRTYALWTNFGLIAYKNADISSDLNEAWAIESWDLSINSDLENNWSSELTWLLKWLQVTKASPSGAKLPTMDQKSVAAKTAEQSFFSVFFSFPGKCSGSSGIQQTRGLLEKTIVQTHLQLPARLPGLLCFSELQCQFNRYCKLLYKGVLV